ERDKTRERDGSNRPRPIPSTAATITRDLRKLYKQRATITFAALLKLDEQIFEIKARPSQPSGKIMEENCESDWRFSFKREENFRGRPLSEQNINKLFFGRSNFAWRMFIHSQIANELQDDRHVFHSRRTNVDIFRSLHPGADCPSHANGSNWCGLSKKKAESLDILHAPQEKGTSSGNSVGER